MSVPSHMLDLIRRDREDHYADQARIAELERLLAQARGLAVDRDQRLARITEKGDWQSWVYFEQDGMKWVELDAAVGFVQFVLSVARGEEETK